MSHISPSESIGLPKLPVLGWEAYLGPRGVDVPGVMNASYKRYTISGRAAISLALQVLGAKPGGTVLLPTYHCTTMVTPVVHAELQPMFYPLTVDGSPNLSWLQQADLSGVVAIIAAHYFGLPQPMSKVRAFCDDRGIALIEDCAHCFFGYSDGKPVGSWGDVAIASLTKFFPVPEGGLIVSHTRPLDGISLDSSNLRNELKAALDAIEMGARHERFPGLNGLLEGVFGLKGKLRGRPQSTADLQGQTDDTNAVNASRLLSTKRPAYAVRWIVETVHQERIVSLRRRNYMELVRQLAGLSGTRILRAELSSDAVPYVFPLYVDDYRTTYHSMRASGIPIFCWDELWCDTPSIEGDSGRDWATHVFQLGCHQDLSLNDITEIARIVRDVVKTASTRRSTLRDNEGTVDITIETSLYR